jgi:hypothetical protein
VRRQKRTVTHRGSYEFRHDKTFSQPISVVTTFFMLMFHIGAVAALFMFSWKAIGVALLLWWIVGSSSASA